MAVIWLLMLILVMVCYYDLPTDNVHPTTNAGSINDGFTSSVQNGDTIPRIKTVERQASFMDKLVLWKGS